MSVCPSALAELGLVRDVLGVVDCNVQVYAASGYRALAGPGSPFPLALTALLTLYVAFIGYRMLFALGDFRLSEAPMILVRIGAILALTLNWGAFQTLVFDVSAGAPLEIARVINGPMRLAGGGGGGGDGNLAANPLTGLQRAYDELSSDGVEFGKKAGPSALPSRGGEAAAADSLWRASSALIASTVGVMAVSSIATGVLTAVGPIFIALFLFEATGGFFMGWVRALTAAVVAPLLSWITTSLLLVVLSPSIEALEIQRRNHALSLDTADTAAGIVLVFAAAQLLLVGAGVMVAGGFSLGRGRATTDGAGPATATLATAGPAARIDGADRATALARDLRAGGGAGLGAREAMVSARLDLASPMARQGEGGESGGRLARLGETYRRGNVMRDRNRIGAAGRA